MRSPSVSETSSHERTGSKITVLGQVVADDALGDVYMVPLCDILDDVKHVLDAQAARLPENNSEINTILRMMHDTGIAISDTAAIDTTSAQTLEKEAGASPDPPDHLSCTQCGSYLHTKETCALPYASDSGGSFAATLPAVTTSYASSSSENRYVWYCHCCSNGPVLVWQNICTECSHERCPECRVEITGY